MSYTLVEGVDWAALDGARVFVWASPRGVTLELKDGTMIKIARAKRPGHRAKARVEDDGAATDT